MAQYPNATPSFTTKQDGTDYPQAAHINDVQAEITAIGGDLRSGLQHPLTLLSTNGLTVGGVTTLSSLVTAPAQPRCLVYSTAAQSFAADVFTAVTFESEQFDVGGLHSTASNPSRITIPAGSSGLYLFGGSVLFSTGGAGNQCFARIIKNSTTEVLAGAAAPRGSSASVSVRPGGPIVVDGGDFFELEAIPAGTTGSFAAAAARRVTSEFWCVKLW